MCPAKGTQKEAARRKTAPCEGNQQQEQEQEQEQQQQQQQQQEQTICHLEIWRERFARCS